MGCCNEKTFKEAYTGGATQFEQKDSKVLKRLNEVEAFENCFPFYRMRIDTYEGRIKRYVTMDDLNTVTLRQLAYSFEEDELWADLTDVTSVLFRLITQPELRDDEYSDRFNVHKLVILGLMLCGGEYDLKARVLYDVLQDNMQKKISASDKDF